jgi:uncharacterized protein YbjT (DUF2867 family)
MSDAKVIAVVGATGAQGGGVARSILADPGSGFSLRALTRDPSKDAAKALADAGAEVVQADIDDEASVTTAFEGAYGAYCLTNFWEHFSGDREVAQAQNVANAAKAAGVQHAIWSTFEDTRKWVPLDDDRMPTLQGHYKVAHFDAKASADHFFTDAGVPTTFLYTSFYWENFIFFGSGPARGEDGVLALTFPLGEAKMPSIAVADIGKFAYQLFKDPGRFIGNTVGVAGDHLSGQEMAEAFTKALGEEVRYNDVDADVYRSFGFPGADDVGNMFQFKRDFEDAYRGNRDLGLVRELVPDVQSLDAWLAANKDRVPIS